MSLYGSSIYGISTYGDSKSIPYNIGFTANTIDYRTVILSWKTTAVNDADIVYAWKIIKTAGGAPDYPNQGQLVTQFVDTTPYAGKSITYYSPYKDVDAVFPSSSIITYSFWGLIGVNSTVATWQLLGASDAVIVDAFTDDTTLRILKLLPGAWTSNASEALGEPDTDTQLYNFVGAFAFYYDKLRAQAGAINNLSDYRKYPKELLPSAVVSLGFTYEPKLGDSFHRSLYKNGHLINSLKGTYLGINNYIKSLTHFKSMISVGRNMMLDYLQSSFEGDVGTWKADSISTFVAGSRAQTSLSKPTLSLAGTYLTDGYGVLTRTSAATGNPTILSYGSLAVTDVTTKGLLVTPGTPYSFSGWALSQSNSSITVQAQIQWFDSTGNLLSTSSGTAVTLSTSSWTKFESSNTYSAVFAPTKAMYAGVKIVTSAMVITNSIYFDNFMFSPYPGLIGNREFGSGDAIYEDAKNININLEGYRTNLVSNPGFEDGVGFWNSINGTLLSDDSPITTIMAGSTNVGKFISTAADSSAVYTNWIRNLKPGTQYTFSVYVLAPYNNYRATVGIEFDMPQSIEDQTKVITSTTTGYEGKYVAADPSSWKTSSLPTSLTNNSWTRISVTATAPEFTKMNGFSSAMLSVEFNATAADQIWYLDCALFEESPTINTYFQGNGGAIPSSVVPPGGAIAPIITDDLIPVGDTAWETKARTNLIDNPSFEGNVTTGWTAKANTTTSFTVGTANPSAKFGTKRAEIAYTGTTMHNYGSPEVSTTFNYPSKASTGGVPPFPTGGELITASAYIAHDSIYTMTVTVTFTDNTASRTSSQVFKIPPASTTTSTVSKWYRVNVTGIVDKPLYAGPAGTLTINFNFPYESNGKIYIDGAQAEFGSYPTTFVNIQPDAAALSGTTQYATNSIMTGVGRSYYWPNIDLKYSRLINTISAYLPIGSTYKVNKGVSATPKDENISSIAPSYSFENNLYGWSALENNTIIRYVSKGFLNGIKGYSSTSWLRARNSSGSGVIGAKAEFHVNPGTKYQFAAKMYAPTTYLTPSRTGTPKIQVTFYTDSTKATAVGSTVVLTSEVSSRNPEDRWAALFGQTAAPTPTAYYAVLEIIYTPSAFSGTANDNIIYIDDVIVVPV